VLHPHVDALLHHAGADDLVHLHADSTPSDVPHDASLSMVELVRHTLVHGTVGLDVHDVTNLEHRQEGLWGAGSERERRERYIIDARAMVMQCMCVGDTWTDARAHIHDQSQVLCSRKCGEEDEDIHNGQTHMHTYTITIIIYAV
jgi:hypothetical protein